MARIDVACFLFLLIMLEISAVKSQHDQANWDRNIHELPYWIQDTLLDYGDEIGDRNITGPIRKIYRKDLDPNYVAYYEFQFEDEFLIFSAGPKTGDHRLVEEGAVPRITDILIAQAAKANKVCQKFFRLNADGTTICEDENGKPVASTMDLRTLTREVNMATLAHDLRESLKDFQKEWKKLAAEVRSSHEWKEMSISRLNRIVPPNQEAIIFKVLTLGDSESIPIGTSDISKVEIKTHLQSSKKMMSTLCNLLGNICTEDGKLKVSSILRKKKNLKNLNYVEIDVTEDFESRMTQLKDKSIDFYLQLTVAEKYVAIRRYTLSLSRAKSKRSAWSGFTQYSIPYEYLMPDYDQHQCCGGCWSGCTPVAWAQIFAYYDRVAHDYGYRYSIKHWRGLTGVSGHPSYKAPGVLNWQVKKYVEALRSPLRTFCSGGSGSTYLSNIGKVDGWFRQRQGSGRVITLSMSNIKYRVSQYVKNNYPVQNSIWWFSTNGKGKKTKAGHSVVVTKIKERTRSYKTCRKVGWWWGRKTKCDWNTEYEYKWYRRMGWGGYMNGWYPASARAAHVAVV